MLVRRVAWLSLSFAAAVACSGTYSSVSPEADAGFDAAPPPADAAPVDTGADAAPGDAAKPAPCDLDGPFVTIEPVDDLNTSADEVGLVITDDGLTAYVVIAEFIDSAYGRSLSISTRKTKNERWPKPERIPGFTIPGRTVDNPTVTADGRQLFFELTTNTGGLDIVSMDRFPGVALDVSAARPVEGVATTSGEYDSYVTRDGKSLYFASDRSGKRAIYRAMLDSKRAATRVNLLLGISLNGTEQDPVPSADDKTLYFSRALPRDGGENAEIFVARRGATTDEYESAVPVPELSSDSPEYAVDISDDGCTLYFTSDAFRPTRGGSDIFAAKKRARP